jgi:hypothetical protein
MGVHNLLLLIYRPARLELHAELRIIRISEAFLGCCKKIPGQHVKNINNRKF